MDRALTLIFLHQVFNGFLEKNLYLLYFFSHKSLAELQTLFDRDKNHASSPAERLSLCEHQKHNVFDLDWYYLSSSNFGKLNKIWMLLYRTKEEIWLRQGATRRCHLSYNLSQKESFVTFSALYNLNKRTKPISFLSTTY